MNNTSRVAVAIGIGVALTSSVAFAQIPRTESTKSAKVYFIQPKDGQVIKGKVKVVMGLDGMGVAPAGADFPETGHHHILVNLDKLPPFDQPLPADDKHRHFGKGQTEAELDLPAGTHTLQLLLGDKNHIPHTPAVVSPKITVRVIK